MPENQTFVPSAPNATEPNSAVCEELDDLRAWLRLRLSPGIGEENAHALLRAFGLPEQIFAAPFFALRQVVGEKKAEALRQEPESLAALWSALQQWLEQNPSRRVLPLNHPDYPQALLALSDAPILLYASGNLALAQNSLGIAVVGSRNPTPQGLENARQFAKHLSARGLCVVSGLAAGIDTAAHEGALFEKAGTIAVVGTGLDRVYPRHNHALTHQISEHGLLLSEFELGAPPLASHFPRRNRLIAALSQGCLVVEATLQSGSLITARLASEQGREVFAIPGSIHSPNAKGCHRLIQQGAKLVESAQDVYDELPQTQYQPQPQSQNQALKQGARKANEIQPQTKASTPHQAPKAPIELDALKSDQANAVISSSAHSCQDTDKEAILPEHASLLAALGFDPIAIDSLHIRTQVDMATLQSALLELELQGHVERVAGGLVQRVFKG